MSPHCGLDLPAYSLSSQNVPCLDTGLATKTADKSGNTLPSQLCKTVLMSCTAAILLAHPKLSMEHRLLMQHN